MIESFGLQNFGIGAGNFERAIAWMELILTPPPDDASPSGLLQRGRPELEKALQGLLTCCPSVPLSYPVSRLIERFLQRLRGPVEHDYPALLEQARTLRQALMDDFAAHLFLSVDPQSAPFYQKPLDGWDAAIERFGCSFDIEEGRKCFALGRYTAAVFHLMKVVEAAVLELQLFLKDRDIKAHFGSVLTKLEHMTQQTKYEHVPAELQSYLPFLRDVIVQLHAVKDSWRNKVSHVDARIVPVDTFTEELAKSVHDATLVLMTKLATGMPPLQKGDQDTSYPPYPIRR